MPSAIRKPTTTGLKRATNVTLPTNLLAEARLLGINVSQACERGLILELTRAREGQWLAENREAIEETNRWVEANGLPLESARLF